MNARSISNGSLVPRSTGSRPRDTSSARRSASRRSLRAAQLARLAARQANELRASAARIRDRDGNRGDVREALFPHRVLDDDGNEVPAVRDRVEPRVGRWRREEVREHEDERAGRQVAAQLAEERERLGEVVFARVERRRRLALLHERRHVLPSRRQPVRLSVAVVERRDVGACGHGAHDERRRRLRDDERLREPRQRRRVDRHRRPPVTDDDDARRLVGRVVADDELVPARRGREASAREPVDRGDRIADLVRDEFRSRRCRDPAAGSAGRRREVPPAAAAARAGRCGVPRRARP